MSLPHGETVTRLRAIAASNVYSGQSDKLNWTSPDELDITGVAIEPTSSRETPEVGSDTLTVDLRLYVPYQVDIQPLDRVVVRGGTYTVEGARLDWRNPFTGDTPGSVLDVRRVAG